MGRITELVVRDRKGGDERIGCTYFIEQGLKGEEWCVVR